MLTSTSTALKLDQFIADRMFFHIQTSSVTKNSIAKNTGLNSRTIDKLLSKDAQLESIDALKLLKLLKIVTKSEFPDVFAKYKDQLMTLGKGYEAIFTFIEPEKWLMANKAENHFDVLNNRVSFLTYLLASNKSGTTISELTSILGSNFQKQLDELVNLGLLSRDNEIVTNPNGSFYFSRDFMKNNIRFLNDFYNLTHAGKDRNYIYFTSEKLNQAGLKKCQEIMKHAHSEMLKVMKDSNYQGSIPYFSTGIMDTFTDELNEKGVLQ